MWCPEPQIFGGLGEWMCPAYRSIWIFGTEFYAYAETLLEVLPGDVVVVRARREEEEEGFVFSMIL
jgi:hypothetical protein